MNILKLTVKSVRVHFEPNYGNKCQATVWMNFLQRVAGSPLEIRCSMRAEFRAAARASWGGWKSCLGHVLLLRGPGEADIAFFPLLSVVICNVTFTVLCFTFVSAAFTRSTLLNIKGSMDGYCDIWESYRKTFPPRVCSSPECVLLCKKQRTLTPKTGMVSEWDEKILEASFFSVGRLPVPATTSSPDTVWGRHPPVFDLGSMAWQHYVHLVSVICSLFLVTAMMMSDDLLTSSLNWRRL